MTTKEFLLYRIEKARRQQRAGDFMDLNKTSLRIFGKTAELIMACTDKKKQHEIIPIPDERTVPRFDGDGVTVDDVFLSSEHAVFVGGEIRFQTPNGLLLSANQYDYVQQHGALGQYEYFAKSNSKDANLALTWKSLVRKAGEARADKAKEILYLTLGTVTYTREEATEARAAQRATAPLLLCPIREVPSKERPRFTVFADTVRANTILARELQRRGRGLFGGVPDFIPYGEAVLEALARIEENATYFSDVEVNIQDINICILDSTNETICQLVEKDLDKLAEAPLIRVFAGEMSYEEMPREAVSAHAIYPLLADDSQREVIASALAGHSMNVSAAAGTGKSQTIVNIAANLVIHGKKLCVMSEKTAANEVFCRYAAEIGLDDFCLMLDNRMSVSQIIKQIDAIRNIAQVYVDPIRARDLIIETAGVEALLEEYHAAVYEVIPEIDMTLYQLIGEAIATEACGDTTALGATPAQYRAVCRSLLALQDDLNNTVGEEEFEALLTEGSTGDEESDELILASVDELLRNGVDILAFIRANHIPSDKIAVMARANLARLIAHTLIEKQGLSKYGNVFLRSKYAKLTECYAKMRSLYIAFMRQQLSARVAAAVREDRELVPLLERLRNSKMTVLDFFKRYGAAVLRLCPIIVTTPSVAVNYITEEMNTFDTLLIDEASQVPIINVLPFLSGKRNLIAFGDNMQLDTTGFFQSEDTDSYDEEGNFDISKTDKSILHLVQGKGVPSLRLLYHYRSKTGHLITVSNLFCYNGALNVVPDVYVDWQHLPPHLGYELRRVHEPFDPVLSRASLIKKRKKDKTVTENPYLEEHLRRVSARMAEEILACVKEISESTPEKSIGIVTLNDGFHDKVLDAVEACPELAHLIGAEDSLWVRSLENAQGKEADIIIIAIEHDRRSTEGVLLKNISGFFNGGEQNEQSGNNRLNVLFTRAREKNIVFIPFDYGEIKSSERSLKRLFTYLEYAATGNMSAAPRVEKTVDAPNECAARLIASVLSTHGVNRKIGEGSMTVDIGVIDPAAADKYAVGFLMPSHALTPNTICTKINLLERAAWRVLPLSLIYLLEKPEAFEKQLPKMMANERRLGSAAEENYLTAVAAAVPITLEEVCRRHRPDEVLLEESAPAAPTLISHLTLEALVREGVEAVCRAACEAPLRDAPQETVDALCRQNPQAFLIKLAQSVHRYAVQDDASKIAALTCKAYYLYHNLGERRAGYLLASLLRTLPDYDSEGNQRLIRMLLEEAVSMNIIREVS